MIAALAALLTAIGSTVIGLVTARRQAQVSDATTKVEGAAAVINGYDVLCEDLRAEISRMRESDADKDRRIQALQQRVEENELEMARLRQELRKAEAEKDKLREKIACLERQNEALQREIEELRRERNGDGAETCEATP